MPRMTGSQLADVVFKGTQSQVLHAQTLLQFIIKIFQSRVLPLHRQGYWSSPYSRAALSMEEVPCEADLRTPDLDGEGGEWGG